MDKCSSRCLVPGLASKLLSRARKDEQKGGICWQLPNRPLQFIHATLHSCRRRASASRRDAVRMPFRPGTSQRSKRPAAPDPSLRLLLGLRTGGRYLAATSHHLTITVRSGLKVVPLRSTCIQSGSLLAWAASPLPPHEDTRHFYSTSAVTRLVASQQAVSHPEAK